MQGVKGAFSDFGSAQSVVTEMVMGSVRAIAQAVVDVYISTDNTNIFDKKDGMCYC